MTNPTTTLALKATARFGYAGKQFVARILGRAAKFTFNREFMGRKEGKRGDYTTVLVDEPGLYETRDIDSKGRSNDSYCVVLPHSSGEGLVSVWIPLEDAMKLAKSLDGKRAVEDCIAIDEAGEWEWINAKEAAVRQAGQTVDSAIAACWAAMEALPEKQAKAVLKALRDRVSPPKAKPEPQAAEQPPADSETPAAE